MSCAKLCWGNAMLGEFGWLLLSAFTLQPPPQVWFFLQEECPISKCYGPEIERICGQYADRARTTVRELRITTFLRPAKRTMSIATTLKATITCPTGNASRPAIASAPAIASSPGHCPCRPTVAWRPPLTSTATVWPPLTPSRLDPPPPTKLVSALPASRRTSASPSPTSTPPAWARSPVPTNRAGCSLR